MENEAAEVVAQIGHGDAARGPFSYPKACSTQARMEERVALPRRMCFAIGFPRGFFRWMFER